MANFVDLSNANGKSVGLPVQQTYMSAMTFITVTLRTAMMTRQVQSSWMDHGSC